MSGCTQTSPAPVWPGEHQPLGATWSEESTNFAVFAPDGDRRWSVCLFDDAGGRPGRDPATARPRRPSGIWHGALPGVPVGPALRLPRRRPLGPRARADASTPPSCCSTPTPGPSAVSSGCDDAIYGYVRPGKRDSDRDQGRQARHPRRAGLRAVRPAVRRGRRRRLRLGRASSAPRHRWTDTVVYELHVKGFTQLHDRVPEELRGTYAGLATPPSWTTSRTSASPPSSCCRCTRSSPSRT